MKTTVKIAADRAYDQTKIVLPAEVARGVYIEHAPSAQALKLMHLMIAVAGGRMADDVSHQLRMADIKAIEGMRNHDRTSLQALFTQLSAAVLIHDDVEKERITIGGLLDEAQIDYRHEGSGDLLVTWWFRRTFRRMAAESNHWAIIDRQTVFALTSKYSILLFQHIASLVNFKHITSKTFTVPELRAILGVQEGKVQRFANLKKDAIDLAIAEINQLSRLTLTATPHKIGRTVASVTIAWAVKGDLSPAKRELAASKVGRKERREDTVETIVASFPDSGSIAYSQTWSTVARQELPQPRRDLDQVA
ncbi:replication initiation protein, partial [Paraburkholderia aspalathi]|nr:replication initiation protein [Paraburkholderia aspalathi]